MEKYVKKFKKIYCYLKEIYYLFIYQTHISGHNYIEDEDGRLICSVCGYKDNSFSFIRIAFNAIKCYYCGEILYLKEDENFNILHTCKK